MRSGTGVALFVFAALVGGCGGGSNDGGGSGTCNPGSTAAFTIRSSGVSPSAVCVQPGGSVGFTNADAVQHDIQGGAGCPELNLGVIAPSGSKSATMPSEKTCTFRDNLNPSNTAFQGTVAVTSGPAVGPGY